MGKSGTRDCDAQVVDLQEVPPVSRLDAFVRNVVEQKRMLCPVQWGAIVEQASQQFRLVPKLGNSLPPQPFARVVQAKFDKLFS